MSDINKDIQPYVRYDSNAGCHIRRPLADEQRAVETLPLCGGNRYEPFKFVAADGELPDTWPYDFWCEGCVEVHGKGKSDE